MNTDWTEYIYFGTVVSLYGAFRAMPARFLSVTGEVDADVANQ